jgi:hypothetical protein
MIHMQILETLKGTDLRSAGNVDKVKTFIKDQQGFDQLVAGLLSDDRVLVMRTADSIEKITRTNASYLQPHRSLLLSLLSEADHKELKWHLAQILTRVKLDKEEQKQVASKLRRWALDKSESRIVRVNALQGIFDLAMINPAFSKDLQDLLKTVEPEPVPSIRARIRKIKSLI